MSPRRRLVAGRAAYARFLGLALASMVVAIVSVVFSAVYVFGTVDDAVVNIAGDAVPAMALLAQARAELRTAQTGLDARLGGEVEVQMEQGHRLADDILRYQELKRHAGELEAFSDRVAHDLLRPLMTAGLALSLGEQRLPPAEKDRTGTALARAERSLDGVWQLVDPRRSLVTSMPVAFREAP